MESFQKIFGARDPGGKIPFPPLEVSPGFRGKPDLMPSQCIACGACACACPANALTIQTDDQQNT
ncbi:4Fe-4S binding protein, partial [Escherichia coli]